MRKRHVIWMLPMIGILLFAGYNRYFYQFKSLDHATLLMGPVASPDGSYRASAYDLGYGGAAGGVLYLVEIEDTRTGEKKIVYSSNHKNTFMISWKSSDILAVTNESPEYNEFRSVELNVRSDIYEESGAACRSLRLRGKFENCYKAEDIKIPLFLKLLGY